jgi:hypothetical protein
MKMAVGQATFEVVDQQATSGPSGIKGLTIDEQGNVFAVGRLNDRWTVRKQTGGVGPFVTVDSWVYVNNRATYAEGATGITSIPAGLPGAGLYVVGNGQGAVGDFWHVRASKDGGKTWTAIDAFNYAPAGTSAYRSQPAAVIADAAGNLYVSGYSVTQTQTGGTKQHPVHSYTRYWLTRKGVVNATGVWSWTVVDAYPDSKGFVSTVNDIALDGAGNVVVVGSASIIDAAGIGSEHALTRSNVGGSWHTVDDFQLAPGQEAYNRQIASDAGGNLFTAGYAIDAAGIPHWIVRSPAVVAPAPLTATFSSVLVSADTTEPDPVLDLTSTVVLA